MGRRVDAKVVFMSQVVVGTRDGSGWKLEVHGVGVTRAEDLSLVEGAVRGLLEADGAADAATRDLQLLLPDFEVDLRQQGIPDHRTPRVAIWSGVIALVVVLGALGFLVGRFLA